MGETPTPDAEVRRLYEEAESRTGAAMERLVGRKSFGELLALSAENTAALIRLWGDAADLVVRNLRLAGRRDVTRLGRQLARTEDKLEQVLQEVERLRAERDAPPAASNGRASARTSRASQSGRSSSGSGAGARRRRSGGGGAGSSS